MSEYHPFTDRCFFCASDKDLARGLSLHDQGLPWDGPTIYTQTPASWCPYESNVDE
jgi:hypothetical protein